jgi:hypothetical protein
MKTTSLSTILLLAGVTAAGCAAGAPGDEEENPGGTGSGSETVPLTPEGKFALKSTFDIATNVPGTAGTVINGFIGATDEPDDPTKWIMEQLVAQLPSGSFKNIVQNAIPFVAGYLNDRLLEVAPDFVDRIVEIGDKFGQVTKNFGTLETLEVTAAGQATKLVTGVHFNVDQIELMYAFKDYGQMDISVPNLTVALDATGKLTVSEHKLPLAYGKIAKLAIDEVIIPLVDPTAVNLEDVLKGMVNCQAVGTYVYEALGIGSASTFQSACTSGLKAGAAAIYTQLGRIDESALDFNLTGVAKGVDKNKDGKMDTIQTGAWAGTLSYAGTPAPLAKGNFAGDRM